MTDGVLFSIILTTFQRNDVLANTLKTLAPTAQTLTPQLYEVIVTDDGRAVNASEMVQKSFPWARWTEGPGRGPAANRNHGARLAGGTWLVFLDDDCVPERNWLACIYEAVQKNDQLDVVEGKIITPERRDSPFFLGVENHAGIFWTPNLTIKKNVFAKLGGFDEDFLEPCCEDLELGCRIRKNNLNSVFVPEAVVYYPPVRVTFKKLWWKTFASLRWHLLIGSKSGAPAARGAGGQLLLALVAGFNQAINQFRLTWHLFKKHNSSSWRTNLFYCLWGWLTLPLTLPYVIYWQLRFQRESNQRSHKNWRIISD